jgi:hypothetical protein
MNLRINRIEIAPKETLGVLSINDRIACYTLELPYIDDNNDGLSDKMVSCIPKGKYKCRPFKNAKFDTFEVCNVPNRSAILFHAGTTRKDIQGCILLGRDIGWYESERAIFNSKDAVYIFKTALKGIQEFDLEIV